MAGIFEQGSPPSWSVNNGDSDDEIASLGGVISISQGISNRVIRKARIGKNGERLDNTGANARTWQVVSEWYNGGQDTSAPNAYPDDVNKLLALFAISKTGWLVLPTVGRVRAQLDSCNRVDQAGERDFCATTKSFIEDSEDDETVASFKAPPASSVAELYTSAWTGSLERDAIVGDPFLEISLFAADLVQLARTPERVAADWQSKVAQVRTAIGQVERAYTRTPTTPTGDVVSLLLLPSAARSLVKGRSLLDALARSTTSSKEWREKKYDVPLTIYDVAAAENQNAERLMLLNSQLEDVCAIPARTPVRIFRAA